MAFEAVLRVSVRRRASAALLVGLTIITLGTPHSFADASEPIEVSKKWRTVDENGSLLAGERLEWRADLNPHTAHTIQCRDTVCDSWALDELGNAVGQIEIMLFKPRPGDTKCWDVFVAHTHPAQWKNRRQQTVIKMKPGQSICA